MFYARFQGGTIDNLFTTGNGKVPDQRFAGGDAAGATGRRSVIPQQPTADSHGRPTCPPRASDARPEPEDALLGTGQHRHSAAAIVRSGLNVSYIWSRGVQLYGVRDLNLPTTTTNFTYTIDDASGNRSGPTPRRSYTGKRPDTRYGTVAYAENGVNSYYNGLAVQVNKRFSHGLQALVSYTWSHEIDDGQSYGESTNNLFLSGASYWLYNGNYKADKGSGMLDQRHRFVLSWVWAPTFTTAPAPSSSMW